MINSSAYLLVVHGSRNLYYGEQLHQLVDQLKSQLNSQGIYVPLATAYLELAPQPLHQKIIDFAQDCATQGYQSVQILPLFLLSGTHVVHDIPNQVALAQLNSPLPLILQAHIGSSADLMSLLARQFEQANSRKRILLAHGTSLTEGNQELETMAQQLQAQVAYWSREPFIGQIVNNLLQAPAESIAILPYFLFTGKITDAIVTEINHLQQKSSTEIIILPTLAQSNEFIAIIINWLGIIEDQDRIN
jgi:sirohydrochlorin ferrochelatase